MNIGSDGHQHAVNGLEARTSNSVPKQSRRRTPFVVGVTGGSGAGKTTFVQRLSKFLALGQTVSLIDLDSYRKDISLLPEAERDRVNFEHPEFFDLVRFSDDLDRLRQGQIILTPGYDSEIHTRNPGSSVLAPGDVVIAEGLMLFLDESVRGLFDLKLFIDTPADIRLRRHVERDVRERGRTLANAIDHYMAYVLPIHERLIEPTRALANFVVSGWEDNEIVLTELVAVINSSSQQEKSAQPASTRAQRKISGAGAVSEQRG